MITPSYRHPNLQLNTYIFRFVFSKFYLSPVFLYFQNAFSMCFQTTTLFFNLFSKSDHVIELKPTQESTHLKVCNYKSYKDWWIASESQVNRKWIASESQVNTTKQGNKVTIKQLNK